LEKVHRATELLADCKSDLDLFRALTANAETFAELGVIFGTDDCRSEYENADLLGFRSMFEFFHAPMPQDHILVLNHRMIQESSIKGSTQATLEFVPILDSNIAEELAILSRGGKSENRAKVLQIIDFVSSRKICVDPTFYLIENSDAARDRNSRVSDALDAVNALNAASSSGFPRLGRDELLDNAAHTLEDPTVQEFVVQRKAEYCFVMRLCQNRWKKMSAEDNFLDLVRFSVETLKKVMKHELYFAWKLLYFPEKIRFFETVQPNTKDVWRKLRGIGSDLFCLRYSEQIMKVFTNEVFRVPIILSFDNRFLEFSRGVSIRLAVFDPKSGAIQTLLEDEMAFQLFLNQRITDSSLRALVFDRQEQQKRWANPISAKTILRIQSEEEKELAKLLI